MANQWIEVDVNALAGNVRSFRQHLGSAVRLAPVVKSNGYGHGLELAARAFAQGGADLLCTHSWEEAEAVRALGLGLPTLILGPLAPDEVGPAVACGHHVTAYDPGRLSELADAAASQGIQAHVHLKVEVGTYRQGVEGDELVACLDRFVQRPELNLAGVHSHFANIEDTTNHDFAMEQVRRFEQVLASISARGLSPQSRHLACSAAAVVLPEESVFDMVRLGISAYGYWSSRETQVSARERGDLGLSLTPALNWKVAVAQVKEVPAGAYVGYGCSWKAEVPTRLAILPVGYADGYRRGFSDRAHVLLHGRRCPVRGRVCMNLIMVDVTHVRDVKVGDEAVLLGRQGDEVLGAEALAAWADTIHYEILAGLGPALPRKGVSGPSAVASAHALGGPEAA